MKNWHATLKNFPPVAEGCFHANYPSLVWEQEACGETPTYRSNPKFSGAVDTVGNGYDYSATTSHLTQSATGSFPSESGGGSSGFTLQLNTNFGNGTSAFCGSLGYSSCQTWEQFIYSSNYPGNAGTGVSGPQAFIQNWLFIPKGKRCPKGWNSYKTSSYNGCYKNSAGVAAAAVSLGGLAATSLAGSASVSGLDTVTFTNGTTAKAVSQNGSTLDIGATWNNSEFNVVGNGGGSAATFNAGSSLTVHVAVNDGTTNAPTCVGPTNGGTTGETNNLHLGACVAAGGSSPYIQFTQSN
ncbi:hypothetical protein [Rudaea sp.]|uniref:hypothetical protein n=1 Tax=Rudaea sp. TaxID=2136325 RepID=UPI002ED2A757